jgi:HK97 family phage prohead protease
MDTTQLIQAIEERRSSDILTKDYDPAPFTKADGETGVLDGYITKYWVVDSYGEFTVPGAFTKTIAERGPAGANKIFLRYEHEYTIGSMTDMVEADDGVKVSAKISNDGMYGTAVREHLKDGVPYGMSIGFRRVASRPASEDDPLIWDFAPDYIRQMAIDDPSFITGLTEVKNLENSVVTFPAVENAMVTDYRSAADVAAKEIEHIYLSLKAGTLTDSHITQLRRLIADLPAVIGPDGETPEPSEKQTADPAKRNYITELNLALFNAGVTLEGSLL